MKKNSIKAVLTIMVLLTGAGYAAEKPNILLVLVDDVGYCDIGAFSARLNNTTPDKLYYETPRIDQLAKEGTMFTQFYACTVCAPTRASLLTGKMNNRMGMWDAYAGTRTTFEKTGKPVPKDGHILDHEPWDEYKYSKTDRGVSIPVASTALHDVKTIPQGLDGYDTAFIGKWHLGSHNHEGYRPEDQGFDETLAYFDGGGSGYHRPFRAYAARTKEWDKPGPDLTPRQDYLCDDVAQRVNRYLDDRASNHADKPFFLYLAHPAAHGPIQSRADDLAYFEEKAKTPDLIGHKSPAYAGLIKGMDRSIGEILDKLDELKLADNTAVIFISDNGGHPRYTRNTPLRGGKSMLYEGGIRVPMIVRWPGQTKAGAVCGVTSDIADIYPTLMEIAGIDYSDFKADNTTDGESLKPLFVDLSNEKNAYTRDEFYHFYGKLGYGGFHNFATWATLRQGDYKLHYDYQGKVELYNIAEDITEGNDLVKTRGKLAHDMLVKLTDWLKANCNEAYLPKPNPQFDPQGKLPYGPYVPLEQLKASLGSGVSAAGTIKIGGLRCEYLADPLGVDVAKPRLSWQLESVQRGQKQTAYRLLVASSPEKLKEDIGDLWDSGKVEAGQSLNVEYRGSDLKSRVRYFWKVRVWDEDAQESAWSEPASWRMGILSQDEWLGQWIQSDLSLFEYQTELKKIPDHDMEVEKAMWARAKEIRKSTADVKEAPAVWMRKEFKREGKKLRSATLHISGLGLYEPYLNGRKINDHLLTVSPHDFGKTVPYHAHDVTDLVQQGENGLGVILANGYYNPVIPSLLREYAFDFIDTPRLRCELRLEYEDDSTQLVLSDSSWKFTTEGPIRFNSIRSGETYDARKELGDWSEAGFDDQNWKAARPAQGPPGRLVNRALPPVRVLKTIPAVSVEAHEEGYRFDIGVESTGWARIKVRGKRGQKIVIKYPGATSHTLGRYQTCEYICKGQGDEFYEPRFAFNGYRYVDVHGLDYTPVATDLVGRQVVSDLQNMGSFSCSDERINYLHEVNRRTIQNYNVQMPMDPVREKVCWTQDVQTNFETSAYNFNLHAIYSKWQDDYIDAILDNGFVPTVVPSCFDGPTINGPWWGGMLIYNPWQLYNFYGDKEILSKSYDAMKRHLVYLDSIAKNNVIEWGLGDWMDLASGGHGRPQGTTVAYTSTGAYMMYADILQKTAVILDKKKEADYFTKRKEEIRKAINTTFYNDETGSYDKGSQTSYILALKLNIPPKDNRTRIVESFRKQIAADNEHLSTGFVGTPFLLTLLNEEGLGDLAWKIATQESYPSWYDMIFNKKNTVFKENWQGGKVQMPSLAGPIGAWFYRGLGGIRPNEPGFKTFIVAPYTNTLDWVKCKYESPYGPIVSNWAKKDGALTMDITVPANTTATVYVPGKSITEGRLPVTEAKGVTFLRNEEGRAVFKVDSGVYNFVSKQ